MLFCKLNCDDCLDIVLLFSEIERHIKGSDPAYNTQFLYAVSKSFNLFIIRKISTKFNSHCSVQNSEKNRDGPLGLTTLNSVSPAKIQQARRIDVCNKFFIQSTKVKKFNSL